MIARARPQDKYTLVKRLKEANRVVAVFGESTSDAPALNLADVGIAMFDYSTEVAKNASDIIALVSDLEPVISGIKIGRSLVHLTNSYTQYKIFSTTLFFTICYVFIFFGLAEKFNIFVAIWVRFS